MWDSGPRCVKRTVLSDHQPLPSYPGVCVCRCVCVGVRERGGDCHVCVSVLESVGETARAESPLPCCLVPGLGGTLAISFKGSHVNMCERSPTQLKVCVCLREICVDIFISPGRLCCCGTYLSLERVAPEAMPSHWSVRGQSAGMEELELHVRGRAFPLVLREAVVSKPWMSLSVIAASYPALSQWGVGLVEY